MSRADPPLAPRPAREVLVATPPLPPFALEGQPVAVDPAVALDCTLPGEPSEPADPPVAVPEVIVPPPPTPPPPALARCL